ncbi:MAG: LamG domain-containing protein, partial [Muribaculaceae bacterium]|nr:LamG domain-containing protein [Muribaculaceae bacterium]
DLDLNLGQFAIRRGTAATPAAPEATLAKVLKNHYKGVDAKLIWNMASSKAADEPVYNIDVNTSVFKLYVQEEGSEPVLYGMTTSWAGLFYSAPMATDDARVRFGVSAVAIDFASESEIAWSDWQERGNYVAIDDIQISKTTLKPGEAFTVSYIDSKHAPASWTIYNSDGVKMAHEPSSTSITVAEGFDKIGGYDVVLNEGTANELRYGYFVQISSSETGAWPEIYSLSIDDEEVGAEAEPVILQPAQSVKLAYTGRDADGAGSRGLSLAEHPFGVRVGELGIEDGTNFSISGWIKLSSLPDGVSSFLTVENRNGSWPANNWGYFWARITGEGKFKADGRIDTCWGMRLDSSPDGMRLFNQYDDAKIGIDAWTHFAVVFEFNGKSRRVSFYLNGVKQTMSSWIWVNKSTFESRGNWSDLTTGFSFANAHGTNTTESDFASYSFGLTANDWITFGGTGHEMKAVDGTIDDFQIWNKA